MNGRESGEFCFQVVPGCPTLPAVTCSGREREGALTTKGTVIRGPPGNGQYSDQPTSQLTPFSIAAHKSGDCASPSGCLYVRRQVFRSGSDQPNRGMPSAHTPVSPSSLLHAPANKADPLVLRSLPGLLRMGYFHTEYFQYGKPFSSEFYPLCFYLSATGMLVQYLRSI